MGWLSCSLAGKRLVWWAFLCPALEVSGGRKHPARFRFRITPFGGCSSWASSGCSAGVATEIEIALATAPRSKIVMASTQEVSSGVATSSRKASHSRRTWAPVEELTLLAALKDLIALGWKSENGFKPGYLQRLEIALSKKFPNCDLKATPHIISRIASWKKCYHSLSLMLSRSGIGFNTRGTHKIECEDDQWEQIVKVDPNARLMRFKSWPYYDDWKEIFGKDRANGQNAEDIWEAFTALRDPDPLTQDSFGSASGVPLCTTDEAVAEDDRISGSAPELGRASNECGKRKRHIHEDLHEMCDLLANMNQSTNERLDHIAKRIGYEVDLGKARQEVLDQLGEIEGLSVKDRFKVCELVAFKAERLDIWRSMKADARAQYVQHLLYDQD